MSEAITVYAIRDSGNFWYAKRTRSQNSLWTSSLEEAQLFLDLKVARKKLTVASRGGNKPFPVIVELYVSEITQHDFSEELEKNQLRAAKAHETATANWGKRRVAEMEKQLEWDKQILARREEEIRRFKGE